MNAQLGDIYRQNLEPENESEAPYTLRIVSFFLMVHALAGCALWPAGCASDSRGVSADPRGAPLILGVIIFDYFWLLLIIYMDYYWLLVIIIDYFLLFPRITDYYWLLFGYYWLLLLITPD